ncbi:MAG TPA: tetratricopeptide repeat protein, partial [Acidimicrobiia bacterium]|nr:tetratricopeptide repeat protein [Acidimicrobiia bacterium]
TTELVEPTEDILTRVPSLPAWRAALALVFAFGGREDEARELLFEVSGNLGVLAFSSTWLGALMALAETARVLDERDEAVLAPIYEALSGYSDRLCVISLSLTEMGPISRPLGVLAALRGDHTRAEAHLLDALDSSEEIGSPSHTARTRVELARVLVDRGHPTDLERAGELLDVALPVARDFGMAGLLLDGFQLKSALS